MTTAPPLLPSSGGAVRVLRRIATHISQAQGYWLLMWRLLLLALIGLIVFTLVVILFSSFGSFGLSLLGCLVGLMAGGGAALLVATLFL